jgi:hypothetical protein
MCEDKKSSFGQFENDTLAMQTIIIFPYEKYALYVNSHGTPITTTPFVSKPRRDSSSNKILYQGGFSYGGEIRTGHFDL